VTKILDHSPATLVFRRDQNFGLSFARVSIHKNKKV